MSPIKFSLFAFALVSVASASHAFAQHVDVRPYVSGGRIVTGGNNDADPTDPLPAELRVFGFDFGEDPDQPYFVQDPGFNALAGSGLPGGSQIGFNIAGPLLYWNGTGDSPAFGATPSAESIALALGGNSRTITSSSGTTTGFALQTVAGTGAMHVHLNSFLLGSDGNATAGDGIEPAAGVYAFPLVLTSSNSGIASSLPFYIVFNNGLSETQHDVAIDAIGATLVPEPASAVALAAVGAATLIRRRR